MNSTKLYINRYLQWQQSEVRLNSNLHYLLEGIGSEALTLDCYRKAGISYPKFFKMDLLSKLAFLAAEFLAPYPKEIPREQIATVLSTESGCIEVDKKFEASRSDIASPALFVYTLPNIMLGEICIRHGFKGEQLCTINACADDDWLAFWVADLLSVDKRKTEACLCGHVEATNNHLSAQLLWVSKIAEPQALEFTRDNIKKIVNP